MIRMTIGGWGNTFGCLLSASAQPVVERTHRNVVLSAPFGVGQAAPATFVDKADLLLPSMGTLLLRILAIAYPPAW